MKIDEAVARDEIIFDIFTIGYHAPPHGMWHSCASLKPQMYIHSVSHSHVQIQGLLETECS